MNKVTEVEIVETGVEALELEKINAQTSDVQFWSLQMMEHCEVLFRGLLVPELKSEALAIKRAFANIRNSLLPTSAADEQKLQDLINAVARLKELKKAALHAVRTTWAGWLFPSFVLHTLAELLYFENKLNGEAMTVESELEFWNAEHRDHAAFAAHLIDPNPFFQQSVPIEALNKIAKEFVNTAAIPENIGRLQKLSEDLQKEALLSVVATQISPSTLPSVIFPELARHDLRENLRGTYVRARIAANNPPFPLF